MKIFTILTGVRFPVLMKLLFRNGLTLYPVYLLRFFVLFWNSLISSVLTLAEKKNYSKAIMETVIREPPVFIVGHWRTGSTYLHQLINLDPQFTAPNMVQTVIPDHFLFSTKYYVPILKRAMPKTRPMDNVALSPFEPQEEEFALVRMGSESPIEKLLFPSGKRFFLCRYKQYIPMGEKLDIWKKNLFAFYKKLTLLTGKRIVSKNPCHSMRIPLLAEMFPGAKFIHIYRDPFIVVPSTIRMWNIVADENKLRRGWTVPSVRDITTVLGSYLRFISDESRKLKEQQFTEVRFEEFEKDPVAELGRIYSELGLTFSDEFESKASRFVSSSRDYKKNSYELSQEEEEIIRLSLKGYVPITK
jgi:hypothetical protein